MDEKTTNELTQILKSTRDNAGLEQVLDTIERQNVPDAFRDYFFLLDKVVNFSSADLIAKSNIDRTYFYQLKRGERNPGRDKILSLCIAAKLTLKETQRALEISAAGILYARNKRDAILIFCIERSLPVTDTNELLDQFGEKTLG